MAEIEYLETLPDIDLLADEGITLEGIMQEMIDDYEEKYEEITGIEKILYPADRDRLLISTFAGELMQAFEFGANNFKQNLIRYMDEDVLLHWGANLGYERQQATSASVELEFGVNDVLDFDVTVPSGTRVTAGDDVFFQTKEDALIPAGEKSVVVNAECTESGTVGNDYAIGQISTLVDPVPYISYVKNISLSKEGKDMLSGDELREAIYMYPSAYSTAGPSDRYKTLVKDYSKDIVDVSVETNDEANVHLYVLLKDGEIPSQEYLDNVASYIRKQKNIPDTDNFIVCPPEEVTYQISVTYYISSSKEDNERALREAVEEAVSEYVEYQYSELGISVDSGTLIEYAKVAGAKRVVVEAPDYIKLSSYQVAKCDSLTITYGGLED